jgi:hypothetical protein
VRAPAAHVLYKAGAGECSIPTRDGPELVKNAGGACAVVIWSEEPNAQPVPFGTDRAGSEDGDSPSPFLVPLKEIKT